MYPFWDKKANGVPVHYFDPVTETVKHLMNNCRCDSSPTSSMSRVLDQRQNIQRLQRAEVVGQAQHTSYAIRKQTDELHSVLELPTGTNKEISRHRQKQVARSDTRYRRHRHRRKYSDGKYGKSHSGGRIPCTGKTSFWSPQHGSENNIARGRVGSANWANGSHPLRNKSFAKRILRNAFFLTIVPPGMPLS